MIPDVDCARRHVHVPSSRFTGFGSDGTPRHTHRASSLFTHTANYDHLITVMEARIRREVVVELEDDFDDGMTVAERQLRERMREDEIRLQASKMAVSRVTSMDYYRASAEAKRMQVTQPVEGKRWVAVDFGGIWSVEQVDI